jgi:hypothetical protein
MGDRFAEIEPSHLEQGQTDQDDAENIQSLSEIGFDLLPESEKKDKQPN